MDDKFWEKEITPPLPLTPSDFEFPKHFQEVTFTTRWVPIYDPQRAARMFRKLMNAASRPDGLPAEVYNRGLQVIQNRCGVMIYLRRFEVSESSIGEMEESVITIEYENGKTFTV